MNSNVIAPASQRRVSGRILAVEPDPSRGATLRAIFEDQNAIELRIDRSTADALDSLRRYTPDVLITSTLLAPLDAALLTDALKQSRAAGHVQIITLPYFIDADDQDEGSHGRVLNFLRRRSALVRPRCDVATLRRQIEEYLERARLAREDLDGRAADLLTLRALAPEADPARRSVLYPPVAGTALIPRSGATRANAPPPLPSDRRRTRRRVAGDVPWLWTVKVPGTSQTRLVDISSGGVLVETGSRLANGSTLDLELVGEDTNVAVAARMVRSQVASVDGLGVRYHVAIAFARELDLLGLQAPSRSAFVPAMLGDVLTRVLTQADRGASGDALRGRFEQELRRMLPVRDIQIRRTPAIADRGAEAIYFTIPHRSGPEAILQATFVPHYEPTAMEFHMLKAAASLAAVILDFAPLASTDDGSHTLRLAR